MDLCGISVIEFRAGRPVLRAHNLTAHLAGPDATRSALADLEEREPERRALSVGRRACRRGVAPFLASEGQPQQADPQPALRRRRLASRSSPRISRA